MGVFEVECHKHGHVMSLQKLVCILLRKAFQLNMCLLAVNL